MDRLTLPELNIDELTAEAMRLLDVGLDDLYAVLGCQLMGVARPARAADLLRHERSLPGIAAGEQAAAAAVAGEWRRSLAALFDELRQDGMRFVAAAAEEISRGLSGRELMELTHEINNASMQVILLIVVAVLKLPRQIEAVCATVAAIFCKTAMLEIHAC
jgi:hypothetical protein